MNDKLENTGLLQEVQKEEDPQGTFFGFILCFILASRFISESLNTFIWDKSNQVWSVFALACIGILLWPLLTMILKRESNIFTSYYPVFIYLLYLLIRVDFQTEYSIKCFFSEFIILFCFIFTIEFCSRRSSDAVMTRKLFIGVVKFLVFFGLVEFLLVIVQLRTIDPSVLINARPVRGIFVHGSIYIIMILPFFYHFLHRKSNVWLILILVACVGTGTRSPFLALMCSAFLVFKIIAKSRIGWFHTFITLMIITLVYGILIHMNSHGWDWQNVDSRWTLSTLQWRVDFWRIFLQKAAGFLILIGHGLGTADFLTPVGLGSGVGFPPHNDFVRIYYDGGLIGLFLFIWLNVFILRLVMRSLNDENHFILPIFFMITCFHITDNFIYMTNALLVYMFLGTYIRSPAILKVEAFLKNEEEKNVAIHQGKFTAKHQMPGM